MFDNTKWFDIDFTLACLKTGLNIDTKNNNVYGGTDDSFGNPFNLENIFYDSSIDLLKDSKLLMSLTAFGAKSVTLSAELGYMDINKPGFIDDISFEPAYVVSKVMAPAFRFDLKWSKFFTYIEGFSYEFYANEYLLKTINDNQLVVEWFNKENIRHQEISKQYRLDTIIRVIPSKQVIS